MKDIRSRARQLLKGSCRVCPVCDGKICSGEVPGMGGLGTGSSFRANVDALAACTLNMRLVHDVAEPDTSTHVLGLDLALPVLAAPIGGVSYNMAGAVSERDYISAKIEGCVSGGILACTGDGVPPEIHREAFRAISAAQGRGVPFIKPWEDEELFAKLDAAAKTGASVCGMDIDAAGLVTLRMQGRPVSPKSPKKLAEIISRTPMKFVVKGVMTVDDALAARDAGAAGLVVSNHGGRVLDHTPGTAHVLPPIARAVGSDMAVFVDGGIRSGTDVLKMLALGAHSVLIGRPFSVASVGGGSEGVEKLVSQLRLELVQAMVLTGCPDVASAGPHLLHDGF